MIDLNKFNPYSTFSNALRGNRDYNPFSNTGVFKDIADPLGIREKGWFGSAGRSKPIASMNSEDYYAQQDAAAQEQLRNYFAGLGGASADQGDGSSDGGSYDASALIRQMMDSINQSYDLRKQQVGQNRQSAMSNLENAMNQFRTNVGANQASYVQGSNQIQQAVAQRAAQATADAAARQKALEASIAGQGGNAGAIAAQAAGNLAAAQQSTQAQQDLGSRMNQIADFNQRGVLNSGDLVRQGAVGQLENQYTDLINALDNARQQELAQAQSGGGGGGGGGGRSSSGKETSADRAAARNQSIIDSAFANNDPVGIMAALYDANKSYAESINSMDFDPSMYEPLGLNLPQYRAQLARAALVPYVSDQAYRRGSLEDFISNYQAPSRAGLSDQERSAMQERQRQVQSQMQRQRASASRRGR